ncbi:hypothetical protein PILCRDRAFT_828065, partial [Piloderma croceum F 1598]
MVKRTGSARLPVELVNIIFVLAAQSSRHACLDLCLVASWARQIALPHLFCTLVAKDHGVKFQKYLADPPYVPINTRINAASLVKNVWMPLEGHPATTDSVLDVFENCHNLMHMALSIHCFFKLIRATSPPPLEPVERTVSGPAPECDRDIHLTMLCATSFRWAFPEYWRPNFLHRSPLYDRITHIRVETLSSYRTRYDLRHFSRLSHLSVPYYNSIQHIAEQLDDFLELRSLEMFVVAGVRKPFQEAHWRRLEKWVLAQRREDKRVFFVEVPAMDIQVEWEREMRGGESIWERAIHYTTQWEARQRAEAAL